MTYDERDKGAARAPEREPDKYTGTADFDFALSPSVIICAIAGAALGLVLATWGTTDVGIVAAVTICFAILSGIFGLFVPWFRPRQN